MDPRWLFLIGGFAGITLLMILASHLALYPWRRSLGQHWTERARLLWPARQVQLAGWVGLLPTAGLLWGVCFPDDNGLWWVLGLILALLLGSYPAAREIEPRYTWRVWVHQMAWTLPVQGGALGLFLWLLFTMPQEMQAADGWRAAGGIAVIAVIVSGIWMPPVMRLFSDAHPQKERLARVVAEASVTSGVTPRYVWLATTPHANAFALVYIRGIVVTTRLMEVVSDEELKAVILHEMAHLREGWAVRLVRLLGILAWTSWVFLLPMLHHFGSRSILILGGVVWVFVALNSRVSRKMETAADQAATQGIADSVHYATALEKLYQANQVPAVMRGKNAHGNLYDRMLEAGVAPGYERPEMPARLAWTGWLLLMTPLIPFGLMLAKTLSN